MATLMPVDRVSISSGGSSIGNEITQRVSIAEGAFFKGLIDIHTPGSGNDGMVAPGISTTNPSGAAFAIQA
jgi:cytoskeletal protein CcmA (bactofilin family)